MPIRQSHAPKRVRRLVAATVAVLIAFPAGVWAADGFNDVPDGNTHHDAINAIRDAGITLGCAAGLYCPSDPVRRDQMASFMDRLGALSGQDPVVNAKTVQGLEPADLQGAEGPAGPAGPEGPPGPGVLSAGAHITRDGADAPVVERWFNNFNGTAPTVTGGGLYTLDFGFDATDKFLQCTIDTNFVDTRDAICTASTPGGNDVRIRVFDVSAGALAPAEFWVHVYGTATP